MTTAKKKACVILGAGASLDVWNEASPKNDERFEPPLAKHLFATHDREEFWKILRGYPGAATLAHILQPQISAGESSVEELLLRYAHHENEQYREHFKQIPAYLRDLLYNVSKYYVHKPGNTIQLVTQLMADTNHEVLFLALNYDDFLEKALQDCFPTRFQFNNMADYISDGTAKLVKLHGSINWFTRIGEARHSLDWFDLVERYDIFKPLEPAVVMNDVQTVKRCVIRVDGISSDSEKYSAYPVLTAPLAGKGRAQVVCPSAHLNAAREFLADCQKFLIIGTSGLDDDLLDILNANIETEQECFLHIVDKGPGAKLAEAKFRAAVRAFKTFSYDRQKTFDDGFQVYVSGQGIREFTEQ